MVQTRPGSGDRGGLGGVGGGRSARSRTRSPGAPGRGCPSGGGSGRSSARERRTTPSRRCRRRGADDVPSSTRPDGERRHNFLNEIDWTQPVDATPACRTREQQVLSSGPRPTSSSRGRPGLGAGVPERSAPRSSAVQRDRSVPLGKYLAQQPVGVLVRAALPRTVRVGEVDRHAGGDLEVGVRGQPLPRSQVSDRRAERAGSSSWPPGPCSSTPGRSRRGRARS